MHTHLFRRLLTGDMASDELWDEDALQRLSGADLRVLAGIMHAPKSGPKAKVLTRLLSCRRVRLELAAYECTREAAELFAAANRKERLRSFAKWMCLWRSGTKLQLAITLLQWRDRCRLEGQAFYAAFRAQELALPEQLEFPL